jgi:hypothetical protein
LLVALSGCASAPSLRAGSGTEVQASSLQGPAQKSSGGRTSKVGLPLTRAQKIGLWTGVAVLLGYLMADDDDDAGESPPVAAP